MSRKENRLTMDTIELKNAGNKTSNEHVDSHLTRGLSFIARKIIYFSLIFRVEGKKVFMGVAQIMLDDLDLSNIVIGWYKLFGTSSLVNVPPGGGKDKKKESTV